MREIQRLLSASQSMQLDFQVVCVGGSGVIEPIFGARKWGNALLAADAMRTGYRICPKESEVLILHMTPQRERLHCPPIWLGATRSGRAYFSEANIGVRWKGGEHDGFREVGSTPVSQIRSALSNPTYRVVRVRVESQVDQRVRV